MLSGGGVGIENRAKVERMLAQGIPKAEVARQLKIARNTLYLRMEEWREEDAIKEEEEREKEWEKRLEGD